MSDEVKNEEVKVDEVKADEVKADEVKADDAKDDKEVVDVIKDQAEAIKGKLSSWFSKASEKASELRDTVVASGKEQFEKAKEAVDDKRREHEANEVYRKLGKKLYKLVKRDEASVPESCQQYIDALDDLYAEGVVADDDADDKDKAADASDDAKADDKA